MLKRDPFDPSISWGQSIGEQSILGRALEFAGFWALGKTVAMWRTLLREEARPATIEKNDYLSGRTAVQFDIYKKY